MRLSRVLILMSTIFYTMCLPYTKLEYYYLSLIFKTIMINMSKFCRKNIIMEYGEWLFLLSFIFRRLRILSKNFIRMV